MNNDWTPSTYTHKLPPSSPRKRKRDIQWSTSRLIETRMQHILHDYTHKLTQKPTQYTLQSDTDPGEDSGGTSLIKEVGILEEEAIVGRSSDIGPDREFPGSGVNGGVGTTGAGRKGGGASRDQGTEGSGASAAASPVPPSRTRKQWRDTVTQITPYIASHKHTYSTLLGASLLADQ